MEFFLLPILMLGLGIWGLTGHDDPDNGDDDVIGTPGNDTISGEDRDTVHAGAGSDLITLSDQSIGHGNDGNDTLTAGEGSSAYGGAGHDWLNLTDDASGHGWEGDDAILAEDRSRARGGIGNDKLTLSGSAEGYGGNGDDAITAAEGSTAYGDDGNDRIFLSGSAAANGGQGTDLIDASGNAQAYGGDGNDILNVYENAFGSGESGNDTIHVYGGTQVIGGTGADVLIAHHIGTGDEVAELTGDNGIRWENDLSDLFVLTGASFNQDGSVSSVMRATVTDFDPALDRLGFVVPPQLSGSYGVQIVVDTGADTTVVRLWAGQPVNSAVGEFTLAGKHQIDPADVRFYSDDRLTPIPPGTAAV